MVEITLPVMLQVLQTAGILVGIVYYLTIMRNTQKTRELTLQSQELTRKAQEHTLETRQAQLFHGVFSTIDEDWWNAFYFFRSSEWEDYSDYLEKTQPWSESRLGKAVGKIAIVFEYLGVLVREGLVDIRLVALLISKPTLDFWEKFEPVIEDHRNYLTSKRALSESEYLYNELIKYLDKHPELKP